MNLQGVVTWQGHDWHSSVDRLVLLCESIEPQLQHTA